MQLGLNLSFAVKRMPEATAWAAFVRERLGLDLVQFTFDLLDPWTPATYRRRLAADVKQAAADQGLTVHSAFVGLAAYTYNGLLHPHEAGRKAARQWWENAIALTAEMGVTGMGGQLGGLSIRDAQSPATAEERLTEGMQHWIELSHIARDAGIETLYIEPTPLPRENPHTVEQATALAQTFAAEAALPVRFAFDIGHALYQPLYGADVTVAPWLAQTGEQIGLIHIQNTDGMSDSHWGWPHPQGTFDLAAFGEQLRAHQLDDRPIFLEVFYPFELADEALIANIVSSVAHCKRALGIA